MRLLVFGAALLVLLGALGGTEGARILGLFGVSGKSHNHFFSALTNELARRGHDLTVVTAFPSGVKKANYREIAVDVETLMNQSFSPFDHSGQSMLSKLSHMTSMFLKLCPHVLKDPQIKPLLDEKFDLIIISTFFNQCFLPFGPHNGVPMIGISSAGSLGLGMDMANPEPTSYVPSLFLPLTANMTFPERLLNTVITYCIKFLGKFVLKPTMEEAAREFFGPSISSIEELERNISLVIYNNHFSLNGARPLNPGTVEAGGMHIKEKSDPLPKDLQEFMDGAKDGVIYFSMGSFIQGSQFPRDKLEGLLAAFAELPQKVIFKWESDNMPNKPSNVYIGKWLPQQSILSHPKLRIFVTHGGLLSTQEAAYHGVPLVGIPFFGDQQLNVAKSARMGLAVKLDFNTLTKESALEAFKTILNNNSFRKNAEALKKRVRDQLDSPLERATFWTEYVLRHNGAMHLRSAATDMAWWRVALLDVYAALFGTAFLSLWIGWKLLRLCCCRGSKRSATQSKKQKVKKH